MRTVAVLLVELTRYAGRLVVSKMVPRTILFFQSYNMFRFIACNLVLGFRKTRCGVGL